jgi:hypothetical protein
MILLVDHIDLPVNSLHMDRDKDSEESMGMAEVALWALWTRIYPRQHLPLDSMPIRI